MKYPAVKRLETPRLVLRKLGEKDIRLFYERLGGSQAVTEHMLWVPHRDISESESSIRKVLSRYGARECCRWAIALKETDDLIGIIDLLGFDWDRRTCSFAYMLGEAFWGCGYGTEAVKAVFRFAFTETDITAIEADHFAENPASGAVMRKAGMHYVTTAAAKYEKNGIKHDAPMYRITREEWMKNPRR